MSSVRTQAKEILGVVSLNLDKPAEPSRNCGFDLELSSDIIAQAEREIIYTNPAQRKSIWQTHREVEKHW